MKTGLPTKYEDLKLDFWFLHLIEYCDGLLNYQAKTYSSLAHKET